MKEQLHTYPVIEAFKSGDECPFCNLKRDVFQHTMDYVLGGAVGSYMETDIRDKTDAQGFCPEHLKDMFRYGNQLGNALILQTYTIKLMDQFKKEQSTVAKAKLFAKKEENGSPVRWLRKRQSTCFICSEIESTHERYLETFFMLIKDASFRELVENCKGFCFYHYADLMEMAEKKLPNAQVEWFNQTISTLMNDNMTRILEDLDWFVTKHDYRFKEADWKNSRDAVSRTMQKLDGIYPSDPPYKAK